MEPISYLEYLEDDAHALLAACWSDPMRTVPTCPEWTLSDLAGHVASAFRWVEDMVRNKATEFTPIPERPEGWEDVSAWFEDGLAALLATLEMADPGEPVWNWMVMAPGPGSFWYRRMAHEASIHRWDAENTVYTPDAIDRPFALDGIDEYLTIASKWLELGPRPELAGSLGLQTTDAELATTVVLAPDSLERRQGLDGADCVVRAGASDLLLWLVRRRALLDDGISFDGDVSVAALWAEVTFG